MIESREFWINLFFMALGTLAIRGTLIAASSRLVISERWKELFSYIPAAILPAFIAPVAFFHQGHVEWAAGKERLMILVLATGVCLLTRSTLATVALGLVALYVVGLA